MRAVVDTNVIAYYLLRTEPFLDEVRRFWLRARQVHAPASWQAELLHVLWRAVRARVTDLEGGVERLRLAKQLNILSVPVESLWEGALARAATAGHPAYDTLFVELAARLRRPLVTFDERLLVKFPGIAFRPAAVPRG